MMIKREVVEKAGMMPEIFFLYYEELDWSTSMTRVGYELWYEPRCTVFHKESQSTGQLSRLRTYYLTRNRLLYARRNLRGAARLGSVLYQSTVAALKNGLLYALKGRFDLFLAVCRGVNSGLILPSATKETKEQKNPSRYAYATCCFTPSPPSSTGLPNIPKPVRSGTLPCYSPLTRKTV